MLSLFSIAGVGCSDGTEGIPQFDVRPLSDAPAADGGGDGPRADGGDAASDGGPKDAGGDVPVDAAVTPDASHGDASADSPADGGTD